MSKKHKGYIPAMHWYWLNALYDPVARFIGLEMPFRRRLNELAALQDGHRVLDLGCGTGTQIITIMEMNKDVRVVGLDFDRGILERARRKTLKRGLDVALVQGTAFNLPFNTHTFDRVVSSMVFHHLASENKARAIREAFRVLRPGGEFLLADFGVPANRFMAVMAWFFGKLEGLADNVGGRLPVMMREAGFEGVEHAAAFSSAFGTLAVYRGNKPLK